jgi:D-3-phosphoglycerate dehydrogenase
LSTEPNAPRVLIYEKLIPGTRCVERFAQHGIEAVDLHGPAATNRRHNPFTSDEFVSAAQGFHTVLGLSAAELGKEVLSVLPDLRHIVKLGIGYEVVDVPSATKHGIVVSNTPAPIEISAVAEHTLALMLAALKRLDYYTPERMRNALYLDSDAELITLQGKTVGIIGFGRIGQAVARRLRHWEVKLLAYDVRRTEDFGASRDGVEFVELDQLLKASDVVTLHAAAPMGHGPLLGADRLATMKAGSVLVNTARGNLIDEDALVTLLAEKHILVAGLDVFEAEHPAPHGDLLARPNIIATPHAAAWNQQVISAMQDMGVTNAIDFIEGRLPDSTLNPDALLVRDGWPA